MTCEIGDKMAIVCTICESNVHLALKDDFLNIYRCAQCDHEFTVIIENHMLYTEDYYTQQHTNWFNNPNYRLFEFIYTNVVGCLKRNNLNF